MPQIEGLRNCVNCGGTGDVYGIRCPVCFGHGSTGPTPKEETSKPPANKDQATSTGNLIPHDVHGKIGASVYRRGRAAGIGRGTRKAKENAEEAADLQVRALQEVRRADKAVSLAQSDAEYKRTLRKYGKCKDCGIVIRPRNTRHKMFLDGSISRGEKVERCYDCRASLQSRIGKAKFAILKRRGKEPKIVGGKLTTNEDRMG